MKRSPMPRQTRPLRARSAKRVAARADELEITEACFRRDGYRCQLIGLVSGHDCHGTKLTPHHLRKQGQGGKWSLGNLIACCAFGNDWIESEPLLCWELGLVVRTGETVHEAWGRMWAARDG